MKLGGRISIDEEAEIPPLINATDHNNIYGCTNTSLMASSAQLSTFNECLSTNLNDIFASSEVKLEQHDNYSLYGMTTMAEELTGLLGMPETVNWSTSDVSSLIYSPMASTAVSYHGLTQQYAYQDHQMHLMNLGME